jgi:hypothetical protein
MAGNEYFSALDLKSAYFQVPIKREHREKTAFSTKMGHYHFNRLGMGLCNAPATFCSLVFKVFQPHLWRIMVAYLDDLVVLGTS